MALSRAEIQRRSNAKNGVRPKTYHLPETTIALIDRLAEAHGISRGAVITELVAAAATKEGISHEPTPTTD